MTCLFSILRLVHLKNKQFHKHAQKLRLKHSVGPLDNQTWNTNGWPIQKLPKFAFRTHTSALWPNGAVFHSVCQVWLPSGPPEFFTFSYCAWLWNWLILTIESQSVWLVRTGHPLCRFSKREREMGRREYEDTRGKKSIGDGKRTGQRQTPGIWGTLCGIIKYCDKVWLWVLWCMGKHYFTSPSRTLSEKDWEIVFSVQRLN